MKKRSDDERAAFERCHRRPACQAKISPYCTGRNEHAHHRQMESQGGPTVDDNLLACCSACHWHIHNVMPRRTEDCRGSEDLGLIIPSWAEVLPWIG